MVDRVGQQLGNYRVSRLIGRGGFADVYLGEHIYLQTPVAIKLLQTTVAHPDDLESFLKEAQTIASLVHPNIVRVMDFGVDGPTPYLVMDYAAGGSLRQRHPRGTPLPLTTILPYVKQVAEALQYAHEEKFIHRDVKPENMLVGRRDSVLLSDFGIALIAQSSRYQSTQEVIGTVAYMSPEQIQGKPRPASDQYSLGIVVYEWLSGDRPFHGSFTELCAQHVMAPPPPLREKRAGISPDVEQVVLTALEKDPHKRFASVQAFTTALEQACQAEEQARQEEEERRRIAQEERRRRDEEAMQARKAEQERLRRILEEQRRHQAEEEQAHQEEEEPLRRAEEERVRQAEEQVQKAEPRALTAPGSLPPAETPIIQTPVPLAGSIESGQSLPPTIPAPVPSPAPSPTRTPRKVSRRTVLVGLAAGGVVVAGGGIAWLVSSLGQHSSFAPGQTSTSTLALYTYTGHSAAVYTVRWSPDGKRIASGSGDKTVQVWDAANGGHVYTYHGHSNAVIEVAWSPDGKRIASASRDKTAQVWDAAGGGHVYTYHGHSDGVGWVAWSPDGKRIASTSYDKTVQVWDAAGGGHVYTYHGHSDEVLSACWSPDGTRIASASRDKTVQVWNAADGGHVFTYKGHSASVNTVAWSPDGTRIASVGYDTVQVWDAANGGHVFTYKGHSASVISACWSPDGKRIASTSYDKTVQVWDAAGGGHVFTYKGHSGAVAEAFWSPDGMRIASGGLDNTVQVWLAE